MEEEENEGGVINIYPSSILKLNLFYRDISLSYLFLFKVNADKQKIRHLKEEIPNYLIAYTVMSELISFI